VQEVNHENIKIATIKVKKQKKMVSHEKCENTNLD